MIWIYAVIPTISSFSVAQIRSLNSDPERTDANLTNMTINISITFWQISLEIKKRLEYP